MATWLVGHTPWHLPVRARLRIDLVPSRLWLQARNHLNIALQAPSPASLEVETMPYPREYPDVSVFEPMSEEYASVSVHGPLYFTPLNSAETLASLVVKADFHAAESLRREMISHHISIPHDTLYLRVALHAITARRVWGSAKDRLDAFEAWLSLAPDRHERRQSFHDIRQRLFRSMDHLNLTLVYRFGVVLASKGYYSGNAAMQVVSTLARYASPCVVERYLSQVENVSQKYHSRTGMHPPSDLLSGAYSLAIRTVALGNKGEAALGLISMAQSRAIRIPDFTLNIVANHALDQQMVIDQIRVVYPLWTLQNANPEPVSAECETIAVGRSDDITALAARLRSLRTAMRSPSPPSPHALHSFITSYQALGRIRAVTLLRSLAYSHSPKSAATWAFTEMFHHRSRREHIHLLFVFSQHFHLVGVPRKTLLSLIRGTRGRQALKERTKRWVPCPLNEKLWPSAYHSALVWEAIVSLSPKSERERLYILLLSLLRQSRQREQEPGSRQASDPDRARLQLPPDTFDAIHFSPFVSVWARQDPARAASVLRDMVCLGVEPPLMQWSMVARGYAQHGDPQIALRILDRFEELERGRTTDDGGDAGVERESGRSSDVLLGVHTNVLRGFVIAGDVHHAREVEKRLVERLGYRTGERPATDACLALLEGLQGRLGFPSTS